MSATAAERVDSWEPVELPVGPLPTPDWVKDMAVNWMDGYGNAPSLAIKVTEGAHFWPGKTWERRGSMFCTLHPDGRGEFLSHNGRIGMVTMQRRVSGGLVASEDGKVARLEPLVMEDYQVLATTQQDGFAGRHFPIVMAEGDEFAGQTVLLRGPWFGNCLPDYCQITTIDPKLSQDPFWCKRGTPWHLRGGTFGMFITSELLLRLFAKYLPHLAMARCRYRWSQGRSLLEPMKPEWDAPKRWMLERTRPAPKPAAEGAAA